MKKNPTNSWNAWSVKEEAELAAAFDNGLSIKDIATKHGRTAGAIRSRLIRLGKIKDDISLPTNNHQSPPSAMAKKKKKQRSAKLFNEVSKLIKDLKDKKETSHSDAPVKPTTAEKKPKKRRKTGSSAAAAKHSANLKGKNNIDPRSIFITEEISPREVSGGLPSLGKRK